SVHHKIFGSPYSSSISNICADKDGNTYLSGEFNKSLMMGPFKFKDRWGGFVAKLDNSNDVVWMKRADMQVRSLKLSGKNLIVFAQSTRTASFANYPIEYSGENYMALLASMSADSGEVEWTLEFTGDSDVLATDMDVKDKNIFVAGAFTSNVRLKSESLTKKYAKNNYIAKITTNGKPEWLNYVSGGDSFVTGTTVSSIAISQYGDLVVAGEFKGSGDFAGECYEAAELRNENSLSLSESFVYLAYFDSNGNNIKVHRAITDAQVTDIAFLKDQVYLCGYYSGSYLPNKPGAHSIFADNIKFDAVLNEKGALLENWYVLAFKGEEPLWHFTASGKNSSRPLSITVDEKGNCYVGGFFYDDIKLSEEIEYTAHSKAPFSSGMLLMKLSNQGKLEWAKTAENPTGGTKIYSISLNNKLVVGGEIEGNAMFDKQYMTSRGKHQNGFVFKFDKDY
ncbi:MAG: hypothetical protein GX879_02410, partial [Bacteroidales bacterium]|nr:hypothetical protein [Bacteroidales bacterium]